MEIVLLFFDGLTALDAIGPYEVLARLPGATLRTAGKARGSVRSDNGCLGLSADHALDEITRADLLVIPGGPGTRAASEDAEILTWVRAIDATTQITASVCTGTRILGRAGLLEGKRATTHWSVHDALREYGATPVDERVVRDGKIATAAGVSAGIDLALTLAAELASDTVAQAIQLGIEYDPRPPFDAGAVHKAPAPVRQLVEAALSAG